MLLLRALHAGEANAQSVTDMIFSVLNEIFLPPTESRLRNKCRSFSAIMRDTWTTLDTQFHRQITITSEHAKITYASYRIHREGGRNIDFRQMSISPGETTANNCKMAFSLRVVESASDDNNF